MIDEKKPRVFSVIDGEGGPRSTTVAPNLKLVEHRVTPHIQLGLPIAATKPETLISVGYQHLTVEVLNELLQRHAPRFFVDLRVAPSFNSGPLSRGVVSELFERVRVQYLHLKELSNRFVGTSLDYRDGLANYSQHIRSSDQFDDLRKLVKQGPLVLLSSPDKHEASERTVLVDALRSTCPQLDLIIWQYYI